MRGGCATNPLRTPPRTRGSASCPDQAPQDFSHAPGLGDAAAGGEWRLGIEDIVDRADTGLGEVLLEPPQKTAGLLAAVGMNLEPGVDERADQPSPDSALVIGRVAGAQIAEIARLVFGVAGRQ